MTQEIIQEIVQWDPLSGGEVLNLLSSHSTLGLPLNYIDILKKKIDDVLNNYLEFTEIINKLQIVEDEQISLITFQNTESFLLDLLHKIDKKHLDIPSIRFSKFEDGIDVRIENSELVILITVYEKDIAFVSKMREDGYESIMVDSNQQLIVNTIIALLETTSSATWRYSTFKVFFGDIDITSIR